MLIAGCWLLVGRRWLGAGRGDGGGVFGGLGGLAFPAVEVGGGDLEALEEEGGAFEVYAVAGEAGGDVGEGLLDGVVVGERGDLEGIVFDDGGDVVGAVVVAHVLVVHGGGAAAGAVLFGGVHALVRAGWFAGEVCVGG